MTRPKRGVISRIVLFAVAVAVVIGFKMYAREQSSQQMMGEMRRVFSAQNDLGQEPTYMDDLVRRAHERAFGEAYSTRVLRDSFDVERYTDSFFSNMIEQARADGRPELAEGLEDLRRSIDLRIQTR